MIQLEELRVSYKTGHGEVHAVQGVSLSINQGQFYTLLGPSGCGKTTTLRCVAGLEIPRQGQITIGNDLVFSSSRNIFLPPYKRDIGMVFQSYAIWPHLSVFENVAFPLREKSGKFSKHQIRDKVLKALALVQLDGLEDRPAPFLSGGQQQRLALARAIVKEPQVLLLDEPLSNLDAKLREETRSELSALVKLLGITTLYVTHDQLEALTMSDVIAVMNQGRIVQEGTPMEIYQFPKESFVANFIGLANFLDGKVTGLPAASDGLGEVETVAGRLKCVLPGDAALEDSVAVVSRPEDIKLFQNVHLNGDNLFGGTVDAVVFMGEALECHVTIGQQKLRTRLHPSMALKPGERVALLLTPERCRALKI